MLIPDSWAAPVMAAVRDSEATSLAYTLASLDGRLLPSEADRVEARWRFALIDDGMLTELLLGADL